MWKKIFMMVAIAFTLAAPTLIPATPAFAQLDVQDKFLNQVDDTGVALYGQRDAPQGDIFYLVGTLIRVLLSLLGAVLLLLIIYSGFLWMTAGGNKERVETARNYIQNAVIGLVIILAAYAITTFLANALGAAGLSEGSTTGSQVETTP